MAKYTLTELDYVAALKVRGILSAAKRWLGRNPPPPEWKSGKYAYAYTEMSVWPWTARDECTDRIKGVKAPEPAEASAASEVTE